MVRPAIQDVALPHRTFGINASRRVGVACAKAHDTLGPGDLVEAADAALYAAKQRWRSTVVEHGIEQAADTIGGKVIAILRRDLTAPPSLSRP
jgi:GGDEF domain-containing protein